MAAGCRVHAEFDPLAEEFLRDPHALMEGLPPVFYAPSLDSYVVTRYADMERVFLDPGTFSAATAQLPLIALPPEVGKTPLDGGHKPQTAAELLDAVQGRRTAPTTSRAPCSRSTTRTPRRSRPRRSPRSSSRSASPATRRPTT